MAAPSTPGWQAYILSRLGAPVTSENLRALNAWAQAEGGGAANNPFNTTENGFGATGSYNSVGVKNYSSAKGGLDATVATLQNGRYAPILTALRQGNNAMAVAQGIAATPWGTGSLVEKVLGGGGGAPSFNPSMFEGDVSNENPAFLSELAQAAQAVGGTKIRVISGYRDPQHNAAVGGVKGSLHTRGLAMDGEVLIGKNWVPLGVALKGSAGKYGLRSGDVPGFFNGAPDPNHVDFGYGNHAGLAQTMGSVGGTPQQTNLKQHIVAQKVGVLGSALGTTLLASAQSLLNGGSPDTKNLFTLAKGFQQARNSIGSTPRPAPLGGTQLAQSAGSQT